MSKSMFLASPTSLTTMLYIIVDLQLVKKNMDRYDKYITMRIAIYSHSYSRCDINQHKYYTISFSWVGLKNPWVTASLINFLIII